MQHYMCVYIYIYKQANCSTNQEYDCWPVCKIEFKDFFFSFFLCFHRNISKTTYTDHHIRFRAPELQWYCEHLKPAALRASATQTDKVKVKDNGLALMWAIFTCKMITESKLETVECLSLFCLAQRTACSLSLDEAFVAERSSVTEQLESRNPAKQHWREMF